MQPVSQTQHHPGNPLIDLLYPAPLVLLPNDPAPAFSQGWTPHSNASVASSWDLGGTSGAEMGGPGSAYHTVPISQAGGTADFGDGLSGSMPGIPQIGEMKIRPVSLLQHYNRRVYWPIPY